jgi:hypothetical protein
MTAWQDQPPLGNQQLSRRQVRQNERGDAVDVAPTSAEQADFAGFPREGWDTEARGVAATQAPSPDNLQAATRRSQRSLQAVEPQAPEPLDYATQGRQQTQNPDGQQLRRRSGPPVDGHQPQDAEPQQQSSPAYRVRDFSPEGRRTSFSSTTPVEVAASEDLQYRTQGSPAQVAPAPVPPAPIERTLSRRELRALRNPQAPAAAIPAPPELVEPPHLRERNRQASTEQDYRTGDALAEFAALTGQVPAPAVTPQYSAPDFPPPEEQAIPTQVDSSPESQQPQEPSTYTPPTGHWSTQAMIDDDEQVQENTLSRNVGATSGAITTSVLVLPSLPSEDVLRPLGSTGEILLTGTIDLPRSLGSTGAHPERYEHPDVDAFLEQGDREDSAPDSAPVRAITAVSTHTSTRNVMEAKKSKDNSRLPVILAVAATAMAVGVVVLVVGGLVFGIL